MKTNLGWGSLFTKTNYKVGVFLIKRHDGSLEGQVKLKGSKSIQQRLLILDHLKQNNTRFINESTSNDVSVFKRALKVISSGQDNGGLIDIEDAGTPARFLLPVLGTTPGSWELTGNERMQHRPMEELVNACQSIGMQIDYTHNHGFLPLKITGKTFEVQNRMELELDASKSSQFASAIALVASRLARLVTIRFKGNFNSKQYFEMTLNLLRSYGQKVRWRGDNTVEIGGSFELPHEIYIEPDWSSMAYWYCFSMLSSSGRIEFYKHPFPSEQSDSWIHEFLSWYSEKQSEQKGMYILVAGGTIPSNVHINFSDCPDLAPGLIVTLAALDIKFSFDGVGSLKYKESNRLDLVFDTLKLFGIQFREEQGIWQKEGSFAVPKEVVRVNPENDHRIAMSFALLAMRTDIIIENVEVVKKSYPEFWDDLLKFKFVLEALK
jgi:3-phosphoshikimate 1-carboxyvinyltransferase